MDNAAAPVRIVFLDRETLSPETTLREPNFPHTLKLYPRTALNEVVGRIADAEIVITNKVRINAEALSTASHLRFIAVAATGYDAVDVAVCKERGIVVSNIRGYAETTV